MFESVMKTKLAIVVLAVVCAGLAVALIAAKKTTHDQLNEKTAAILDFSNQLVAASDNLDELRQVNLRLTNDLATVQQQTSRLSNNLTEASDALSSARATIQGAQDQIANLNGRITDLEAQNKVLDDRANALSNAIVGLDAQIAETKAKLAAAETNNTFLAFELQKQMQEKAELQRKFGDLDEVRAQVKKLRDEAFSARRLEWISSGTGPGMQPKGAQLLMNRPSLRPAPVAADHTPRYDLDVEVGSDGSVHVLPPPTNSAAH